MSNLRPEKRVDKNGVLTTKHVRVDPKASASASPMPSPSLAPQPIPLKPTKAQTKLQQYKITFDASPVNKELRDKLRVSPYLGFYYRFEAKDTQCYDVLSVTSRGNALHLLASGIRSASAAVEYLEANGLGHLIEDNSSIAQEGLERRIPVFNFLTKTHAPSEDEIKDNLFWDSLEIVGKSSLRKCEGLPQKIRNGTIRLDDIKALGLTSINQSVGWGVIESSLEKIASGEAKHTVQDLKMVVNAYGDQSDAYMENAIELCEDYDAKFATSLTNPNQHLMRFKKEMQDDGETPEKIKSVLRYFDDLWEVGPAGPSRSFEVNKTNVMRFHDAGVSPSDAYYGKVTLAQLDAIEKHGISPSVSGGWL